MTFETFTTICLAVFIIGYVINAAVEAWGL
jgi:hypothetical protein